MTSQRTPDEKRAEDILTRMQKKEHVGVVDTIYIYLWVFAVTEYGVALKATMLTFALALVLLFPCMWFFQNVWVATTMAFVVAFCIVTCYETAFGFLLALILLPLLGILSLIYFGLRYMGVL